MVKIDAIPDARGDTDTLTVIESVQRAGTAANLAVCKDASGVQFLCKSALRAKLGADGKRSGDKSEQYWKRTAALVDFRDARRLKLIG